MLLLLRPTLRRFLRPSLRSVFRSALRPVMFCPAFALRPALRPVLRSALRLALRPVLLQVDTATAPNCSEATLEVTKHLPIVTAFLTYRTPC